MNNNGELLISQSQQFATCTVIADGDDPERSRDAVNEILATLGVAQADLIDASYFELLAKT